MGRKSNPNILRISSITRNWDPKWFADRASDFRKNLSEDLLIRNYFAKYLRSASVSSLEITRDQRELVLTIHTSRPAMVIGRGGSNVEKIQKDLKKKLQGNPRIRLNVQEVRNPDTDASAVATQIVDQLERRMPFRRILKQSISRSMSAGAVGVRISLAGRLNGAEIARTEWLSEGNVPLHTFRANISYAQATAITTYGTIGVKVWVNRGDLTEDDTVAKPVKERAPRRKKTSRRRSSLAQAAAKSKGVPGSKKDTTASAPKKEAKKQAK